MDMEVYNFKKESVASKSKHMYKYRDYWPLKTTGVILPCGAYHLVEIKYMESVTKTLARGKWNIL